MMEKGCSCLFLDTTIQIEKVLGRKNRKREIQSNLQGRYVITSRYVLMEYIRTVVKDFYYIYNILKEESNTEEFKELVDNFIQREDDRIEPSTFLKAMEKLERKGTHGRGKFRKR